MTDPSGPPTPAQLRPLLRQALRPYNGVLALGVAAGIGDMAAQIAIPWILRFLIDDVLVGPRRDALGLAIAGLVAAAAATSACRAVGRFAYARLGASVAIDLRNRLLSHLRRLPLAVLHRRRSGELMSLFTTDVPVLADYYESVLGQWIVNVVRFVTTLALLVYLFRGLTVVVVLLLPLYTVLPALYSRRLKNAAGDLQAESAALSGDLQDSIAASREIMAFNRERWDEARLDAAFRRLLAPRLRIARLEGLSMASFLLLWISAGILYAIGGRLVFEGRMTIGELLAAIAYFTYLNVPVSGFIDLNSRWQRIRAAGERVVGFLGVPREAPDRPGAQPLRITGGEVVFDEVSFRYPDGEPVLDRVSLRIEAGRRLALVGASGAGKSTLIHLLLRLLRPTGGRVLVDGQDLDAVTAASLRAGIGAVFQASYLFPGTVEENIRFGDLAATREQVEAAARAAHAHAFVTALPGAYATPVGERGVTLSAGQAQRIAIARVLLRDPRVLVLDEATSAVDSLSEQAVQEGLDRLMRGRTVLLVSHRLSTVAGADAVALLEGGRITAQGRHDELMEREAGYRRLFDAQRRL